MVRDEVKHSEEARGSHCFRAPLLQPSKSAALTPFDFEPGILPSTAFGFQSPRWLESRTFTSMHAGEELHRSRALGRNPL